MNLIKINQNTYVDMDSVREIDFRPDNPADNPNLFLKYKNGDTQFYVADKKATAKWLAAQMSYDLTKDPGLVLRPKPLPISSGPIIKSDKIK